MINRILLLGAAVLLLTQQVRAEYRFFSPKGSFAVEVSLENPGPRLRLPIYRNRITSLAAPMMWCPARSVVSGTPPGVPAASNGSSALCSGRTSLCPTPRFFSWASLYSS